MTPLEKYQSDLQTADFKPDDAQAAAVDALQDLYERLLRSRAPVKNPGFLSRLMGNTPKPEPECGLYLWGGTGRGKTYLMDCFYDVLPLEQKRRVHFQHLMKDIHEALKYLPKSPDPLPVVAGRLAESVRVLCVDEFHVDDITDAMILAGLLRGLFEHGITLVATSNICPDDLYLHGLQRSRFVPAIELIKKNTQVLMLDSDVDYRLALLEKDGTYHVLSDEDGTAFMTREFEKITHALPTDCELEIVGRKVNARAAHGDTVWFDFRVLCDSHRSSLDYMNIAQDYNTLLLTNVPVMHEGKNDAAQRFIQLVDALYDHGVKLIISAHAMPNELYTGQGLAFPFQRTISRLFEMRSHQYLSKSHGRAA